MNTVGIGGASAALLVFSALLGWAFGLPFSSALGPEQAPMAPSTAALFLLYGIAALFRLRASGGALRAAVAVGSAAALMALLLSIISSSGIRPASGLLGLAAAGSLAEAPVGHMSPLPVCFLLAGLSFLGSLPSASRRRWPAQSAWWIGCLLLTASSLLLLAHLLGGPLLEAESSFPPAANTCLAFAALATALLALASRQARSPAGTPATDVLPRALVPVYVLLAAAIVAVGGHYFRTDTKRHRAQAERELAAVAELKASELTQWRAERLGDAALFQHNAPFSALVGRALGSPRDVQARAQVEGWLTKVQTRYLYDQVALLDAQGAERLAVPAGRAPVSSAIAQRVPELLRSGAAAFADLQRHELDERVYLSALVPIFDEGRRALGIVALRIDPETSLYPLIERWPTAARTAEALLVRRDGNGALFLSQPRVQQHTALSLRLPRANRDLAVVQAVLGQLGQHGVAEARDQGGAPVIAAFRAVPGSPWVLLVRMDAAAVDAPLREQLWVMVVLVGGLLAAVAVGLGIVWRTRRAQDSKERYEAEQERGWLHDVIARSLNEVYVFDPATLRIRFANRGACRNLGYTEQELARLTLLELKPELTSEALHAMLEPLRAGERPAEAFETVHRRKDGSEYPVEVHLQLVDSGAGAVFLAIVNDITERRRAETRIRHLGRVYALLSDVNQAIVRVREPQALFAEACRIAVETGGFRMAWVGLLDAKSHGLRSVARAGPMDGELDDLETDPAHGPAGLGPAASVLRQGSREVCNDVEHDPRTTAWRHAALARGYRAAAAFPLTVGGQTLGAITLYASEPGFFDDEELRLLDELAVDLSFAMEMARLESVGLRLATAIEQSPVSVMITDTDGRIEYVNPAFSRISGYGAEEALGGNPRMLKSGKQEPALYRELWATIGAGRSWHGELVNLRRDGSLYAQELTITPVRGAAGRVEHFVAISQDVTERNKRELALRMARFALDHSADMIVWVDREGQIVYANETAQRLLGYSQEELLGLRLWQVSVGLSPESWPKAWEAARQAGSAALEDRSRRKDGSTFPVEVAVTHLVLGDTELRCSVARDIGERKRAEQALRDAEARYRVLFEQSPDGVLLIDPDTGKALEANEAAYKQLGYTRDEFATLRISDYEALEQPEETVRHLQHVLSRGSDDFETLQRTRNGEIRNIHVWAKALRLGERPAIYSIFKDVTDRRRAEAALRDSETRLRRIVENIHDALYVDDADGKVVFANGQFLALFGVERDQLARLQLEDYVAPEWRDALRDRHERRLRGETVPTHFEYEGLRQDGGRRWIESTVVPLLDDGGSVIGTQVADRDITQRKQAEAALRASEQRYRAVAQSANEAIVTADSDGNIVGWNRAAESMFGYPEAEVGGQPLTLLMPPRFRQAHLAGIERVRFGGPQLLIGRTVELTGLRKDESEFPIELSLARWQTAEGAFVTGVMRDTTERKRAEASLRSSEERYRGLFDHNLAGVYRSTVDGRVLECNDALARIFGYASREELVGAGAHALYPTAAAREAFLESLGAEGAVVNHESEGRCKDGSVVWLLENAHLVPGEAPEAPGIIEGTLVDITERRRLEAQLRQSQKMEAIGQLAGGVAHDFNNILGVIMGYGELAQRELGPQHAVRARVDQMLRAAERAAGLTRQLLAFSRKQVMRPRPLDLQAVVADMQKLLGRLIGEDVRLLMESVPDLGTVSADPTQVEQIVLNLALNARDAMPKGGSLILGTANVDLDEDYCAAHPPAAPGRYVMLAVSDTGLGMDQRTQQRIFEPFFTTKPEGKGTGLGLATVYGIVKQSGGYIWVYSEPGLGTTFRVYLPRVDAPPVAARAEPAPAGALRGNETILLVEDNEALREGIRETLEELGYTVLPASNGHQALALASIRDGPIDLVLTDVVMPKLGGVDLVKLLSPVRPGMRVLYMSGYADGALAERCELGEAALLQKPFTWGKLAQALREALDPPAKGD